MQQKPAGETRYLQADGTVKPTLISVVDTVLNDYVQIVDFWHKRVNKSPQDFAIREVHIIGSVLKGKDISDLDLLMIADYIGQEDYRFIKNVLAQRFYTNRSKISAIDVYVRPYDEFPERPAFEITDQLREQVEKCNQKIKSITPNHQ